MTDVHIQGCMLHWILHIFPVIVTTVKDENIPGFIQHIEKQRLRSL